MGTPSESTFPEGAEAAEPAAARPLAGGDRWSVEDAERVIGAWRESGQSISAYARTHGLSAERIRRWQKLLSEGDAGVERPLRVEDFATAVLRGSSEPSVVIRCRTGHTIEVSSPEAVAPHWVGALVKELEREP